MITVERLRALLHYDPDTGLFRWLVKINNQLSTGAAAGWLEPKGYWRICVDGRNYQAHRLAWLWMTGQWPDDQIDHVDLNKSNNCWANLRQATNSQNQANTRSKSINTSGIKGVYWHKRLGKWQASISVNGRLNFLGYRESKEEAAQLYRDAALWHFGQFARAS